MTELVESNLTTAELLAVIDEMGCLCAGPVQAI